MLKFCVFSGIALLVVGCRWASSGTEWMSSVEIGTFAILLSIAPAPVSPIRGESRTAGSDGRQTAVQPNNEMYWAGMEAGYGWARDKATAEQLFRIHDSWLRVNAAGGSGLSQPGADTCSAAEHLARESEGIAGASANSRDFWLAALGSDFVRMVIDDHFVRGFADGIVELLHHFGGATTRG